MDAINRRVACLALLSWLPRAALASHIRDSFSWDDRTVGGFVGLSLVVPLQILFITWFWQRRDFHPVKGRTPLLTTFGLALLVAWTVGAGLTDVLHGIMPCVGKYWIFNWLPLVTATIYGARTWHLWFRHGLAAERLARYEDTLKVR